MVSSYYAIASILPSNYIWQFSFFSVQAKSVNSFTWVAATVSLIQFWMCPKTLSLHHDVFSLWRFLFFGNFCSSGTRLVFFAIPGPSLADSIVQAILHLGNFSCSCYNINMRGVHVWKRSANYGSSDQCVLSAYSFFRNPDSLVSSLEKSYSPEQSFSISFIHASNPKSRLFGVALLHSAPPDRLGLMRRVLASSGLLARDTTELVVDTISLSTRFSMAGEHVETVFVLIDRSN